MNSTEKLLNYCRRGPTLTEKAIKILDTSDDIDLTDEEGLAFKFAIKYDDSKLLNALLGYYEQHKPSNAESSEYKEYIGKFHIVLSDLIYSFTNQFTEGYIFSTKIKAVLERYLENDEAESDRDIEEELSISNSDSFEHEDEWLLPDSSIHNNITGHCLVTT